MIARWRPVTLLVVLVVVGLAGAMLLYRFGAFTKDAPGTSADSISGEIPSLMTAAGWLNGGPLTADSLAGHPTVLLIWSDSDPRSLQVLPEVQGWHQAYARYGVRVVGVHVPDYSFGADPSVPASVARRYGLGFPIALDPEYRVQLRSKSGEPLVVLADASGRIVGSAEGRRIAGLDRAIRDQVRSLHPEIVFPQGASADEPSVVANTPPTRFAYLGTARVSRGPLAGAHPGEALTFTAQFRFQEEGEAYVPYPVGRWTPSAEGLTATRGGAMNYVAIRTRGERVSVVMKPADVPVKVWVLADDAWMSESERDTDVRVDARGATYVELTEPRLYRLSLGGKERVLKLSPEDPGVTLYAFGFEPAQTPGRAAATPRAAGTGR